MNDLPDLRQRREVLDPERSFIVVAPAGAGKTQVLVKRYLTLLGRASSVDSIVALTFTNKAAEEMRGRVFSALRCAASGAKGRDENEEELFSIARAALLNERIPKEELLSPGAFRISTFHGFCLEILRSYPLEAEVTPGFTVFDETEEESAFLSTAEQVVASALSAKDGKIAPAVARRLAALGGRSDELIRQIAALIKDRDRAGLSPAMSFGRREEMVSYILGQYGSGVHGFLEDHFNGYSELARALIGSSTGLSLPDTVPALTRGSLGEWKRIAEVFLTGGGTGTLRKTGGLTPKNGFPEGFKGSAAAGFLLSLDEQYCEELRHLAELASKAKYDIDENGYKDLGIILERATELLFPETYAEKLDFVEMEAKAVWALTPDSGAPTKAMIRVHSGVKHILVDEAQDLGDGELEIISRIADSWEPLDKCTVFIVGDPKQSIYRFRKANVAIFEMLMEKGVPRKGEAPFPLEKRELLVNFRSEAGIIDFVNGLFEPLMQRKPFLDGVEFSRFTHPTKEGGPPRFVNAQDGTGEGPVTIAAFKERENLLDWFAGEVGKVIAAAKEDEEIALLYHRRSAFQPYLEALQDAGIAINVVDGTKLEDLPTVNHLLNLLKAVTNLRDDLSWSLILGAPWFDLGPAELLELSRIEGAWSERVLGSFSIDQEKREALKKAVGDFREVPGGRALRKLWLELDGPALYSSLYGLKGVEQARSFFSMLEEIAFMPGSELVSRMELLLSSKYAGPDPEASLSKIKAMTVHKAKGLEFDTVFVVGLDSDPKKSGGRGNRPPLVVERLKYNEETQKFEFYDAPFEANELCYEILGDLDSKRGEEEFLRLNYVALTRAKKKLYLVGDAKKANKNSFLKMAIEQLEILPVDMEAEEKEKKKREARKPRHAGNLKEQEIPPIKVPFTVVRASEEVGFPEDGGPGGRISDEESRELRMRGIAIHKVLERLAKGGALPTEKAMESWLLWNREPVRKDFAKEILGEANNAWNLEAVKEITRDAELIPEYAIEMKSGEKEITVGRLDLLIKKEGEVHIIDYKTGRPGEDTEAWMSSKLEEYRPQVSTYKKMISLKEGIVEEKIKAYILFTRVGELREV